MKQLKGQYFAPLASYSSKQLKGFTIVELLVVIVIIGILATITAVSYTGITQKATAATLQSDLKNASTILEMDKTINGTYPATAEDANGGKGLQPSAGTTLTYTHDSATDSYGLIAANNSITYSITSENKTPIASMPLPGPISNTFAITLGGIGTAEGFSLVQTSDGGYAVTGVTDSYGARNMFIAKYNSVGTLNWSKTWGGVGDDYGNSLVQTSDGGYAVTGYTTTYGAGGYDMFIAKYDSIGTLIWNKTWGGIGKDIGNSIVQTSDDGYAVTGQTRSYGAGYDDVFLAKYDSAGTLTWSKTWGGLYYDQANSLVQTSDGGYAITGETNSFGDNYYMFILKYDLTGTVSWNKTWVGYDYAVGVSIVQTGDSGYAITGKTMSYDVGDVDVFLAKYDSSGILTWNKTWGGVGNDYGLSLVQTNDGGYAVTGETDGFGAGGSDMFLAKYNSAGVLSWNKTWGGDDYDLGYSIVQTNDGGYAVTGHTSSYGGGNGDVLLVKYNSIGSISGCSEPMCQTPTSNSSDLMGTVASPSATAFNPTATVWSPASTSSSLIDAATIIVPVTQI